ncbi:MAG: 23S rRNA (guanosine(2251)-2'-O)-methyltransferase RlmB [Saprospiraceae bacterium]|nr:23S rRNA (guanosine(2251)-2'-O)-methyltransferase RlmB [Saprospiraceae bacterium]
MEKVFGRMPVIEALKKGSALERVYIQDSVSGAFEVEVRTLCQQNEVPLSRIPKSKLDRDIHGNHQGIYAIGALVSYRDLETLIKVTLMKGESPLLLLLDGIKDVRNLGAIARSAEIFGAHGIVIPSKGSAPINDIAIKTSAGALLHLPVCRVKSMQSALDLLCRNEVEICGADQTGDKELSGVNFKGPCAIVFGEEGKGINNILKVYFDHHFHIPQIGKTESLNVSVAAGIVMYEVFRQRS